MRYNGSIRLAPIVLAAALSLLGAACTSKGGEAAGAVASAASGVATNPQTVQAEQAAMNTAINCAVTAQIIKEPADVTYTVTPKFRVTKVDSTYHVFTDPKGTTTAFTTCMQGEYGKGTWIKIRNCVQKNPPAFGKGFTNRLIQLFATCVSKYSGGGS